MRLFATKVLQFVEEGALGVKPTHLAMILDKSENSFRKELYPEYKAHRPPPPEDLVPQFPLMRHCIRAFGLHAIEQDTYEADDLIATYAEQACARGADVLIISADKDLMQLVRPCVAFYDPESGIKGKPGYRPERLLTHGDRFERWNVPPDKVGDVTEYWEGLPPEKIVDIQSLEGDTSDNVPGAPGIGRKTAAQLLTEYGDLDTLLARAHEIKQPKRRETLTDPAVIEKVRISRKLVELVRDVPVVVPLDETGLAPPDGKTLVSFLKAMEFTTITRKVADLYGVDAAAIEPDPALATGPKAAVASASPVAPLRRARRPPRPSPIPASPRPRALRPAPPRACAPRASTARATSASPPSRTSTPSSPAPARPVSSRSTPRPMRWTPWPPTSSGSPSPMARMPPAMCRSPTARAKPACSIPALSRVRSRCARRWRGCRPSPRIRAS